MSMLLRMTASWVRQASLPAFRAAWAPRAMMSAGPAPLTEAAVQERVLNVVKNFQGVDPQKVTPSASFSKDLGLDSLTVVEVRFRSVIFLCASLVVCWRLACGGTGTRGGGI